jgi:hypothetical protein
MSSSEDGMDQEKDNKLSDSTRHPRPLSLNITPAIHLISIITVDLLILESLPQIQDGGKCSK